MSTQEKERISLKARRTIIIGLICFAVLCGASYPLSFTDAMINNVIDLTIWAILNVLSAVLVIRFQKIRLDKDRVVRFIVALAIALLIMLMRPWMAFSYISERFSGMTIFEFAMFYRVFVGLICATIGITITLVAITRTIPHDLKRFCTQTLIRAIVIAIVLLIIMNLEIPIVLFIPTEYSTVYLCFDAAFTQLIFSPVYYYVIASFFDKTKPFTFPRRR